MSSATESGDEDDGVSIDVDDDDDDNDDNSDDDDHNDDDDDGDDDDDDEDSEYHDQSTAASADGGRHSVHFGDEHDSAHAAVDTIKYKWVTRASKSGKRQWRARVPPSGGKSRSGSAG